MKITYENDWEQPITEQQARKLDEYYIVYWENEKIKKKEHIDNGEIIRYIYYRGGETISEILAELNPQIDQQAIIVELEYYGEYRHEKLTRYDQVGVVLWVENYLFNSSNKEIAYELIDLLTGEPTFTKTKKYFYDAELATEPEYELFRSYYGVNGNLTSVSYDPYSYMGQDGETFFPNGTPGKDDLETLRLRIGVSEAFFNYYLTASILPPPQDVFIP